MRIERRRFIQGSAAAALAAVFGLRGGRLAALPALIEEHGLKIGGCDWSLGKEGDLGAFDLAKAAGLDGVEVSCGKAQTGERLPIADPERQKKYLDASKAHGLPIASTCLEVLHRDGLKDHPDAPKWIAQAIEPTKRLGAGVILLPLFFKQAIEKRSEQEAVAARLKDLAPEAQKAGVVLGLENSISAKDNGWLLDQVNSSAVQVYYDVGNSHRWKHDIYSEVEWLGKERICSIHLKDQGYLGEGAIDFPRFLETVLKCGYSGWLMLETRIVKKAYEDFKRNADFVRSILNPKKKPE